MLLADKLGQPRILGAAKSNLTLTPEEVEGAEDEGRGGPVAYLSCEVVSLGATQVLMLLV